MEIRNAHNSVGRSVITFCFYRNNYFPTQAR
jgi:hypothetical protein